MELKNDIEIRGTLKSVDQFLNLKLHNVSTVNETKYPQLQAVKTLFVRGSNVRYVHLSASSVDCTLLQDASRRGMFIPRVLSLLIRYTNFYRGHGPSKQIIWHIHRRRGQLDVYITVLYYFNTTQKKMKSHALLANHAIIGSSVLCSTHYSMGLLSLEKHRARECPALLQYEQVFFSLDFRCLLSDRNPGSLWFSSVSVGSLSLMISSVFTVSFVRSWPNFASCRIFTRVFGIRT